MEPFTRMCKCWPTNQNSSITALCRYRMWAWRPTRSDEWLRRMARVSWKSVLPVWHDGIYNIYMYIYIYIYIYIYTYCHPQIDCFVVSQLFSVARNVGHFKQPSFTLDLVSNRSTIVLAVVCLYFAQSDTGVIYIYTYIYILREGEWKTWRDVSAIVSLHTHKCKFQSQKRIITFDSSR